MRWIFFFPRRADNAELMHMMHADGLWQSHLNDISHSSYLSDSLCSLWKHITYITAKWFRESPSGNWQTSYESWSCATNLHNDIMTLTIHHCDFGPICYQNKPQVLNGILHRFAPAGRSPRQRIGNQTWQLKFLNKFAHGNIIWVYIASKIAWQKLGTSHCHVWWPKGSRHWGPP